MHALSCNSLHLNIHSGETIVYSQEIDTVLFTAALFKTALKLEIVQEHQDRINREIKY